MLRAVLQDEMVTCMKLLGAKEVSELGPRFVSASFPLRFVALTCGRTQINSRMVERDIFDGGAGLDKAGLWTARAKL